jgi:hypothetical protein
LFFIEPSELRGKPRFMCGERGAQGVRPTLGQRVDVVEVLPSVDEALLERHAAKAVALGAAAIVTGANLAARLGGLVFLSVVALVTWARWHG